MESNPKEIRRLENEEIIDRISDQPDSVLSKILSHLPTKYAVGASILSTRWKNMFPFGVPPVKLDLDDTMLLNPTDNDKNSPCTSFTDFVDKLLNEALSDVHCVEQMTLNCDKNYGDSKIASWVCGALELNVKHLYLKCSLNDSETLFHSLNGCTTLLTLQLSLQSELCLPDDFTLPNLMSLHLNKLIFNDHDDKDSINELIEGCPALEYLYLLQCNLQCYGDICIQCPLLKNLVIEGCWTGSRCGLILDVPKLELFFYNDFVAGLYSVCLFESLHTAHIDIAPTQDQLDELEVEESSEDEDFLYYEEVAAIVADCSSTIRLYLSSCVIDSLHRSSMQLPVFQNLTWLSLGCLGLQWALLARLLLNAPNLQQLTLEEGFEKNEGELAKFKNLLLAPPECLLLHLKIIEFWVFNGDEDEFKLVEYFLKNGEVLQKLIIRHCLPHDDTNLLKRFLMLPRQSKTCRIDCRRK